MCVSEHSTASISNAEHAKAAGAKRLVLTHILPTLDPEVSREEAALAFDGVIDLAEDGITFEVGP